MSVLPSDIWRLIASNPSLRVRDILRLCQVCKETHNAIQNSETFWITFRKTRYPSLPAYTNPYRIRYRCQELEFDLIEDTVATANRDVLVHSPYTVGDNASAELYRKVHVAPRNIRQLISTAYNSEILRILTSLIDDPLCDFLLLWLFSALSLESREKWLFSHIIDPTLSYRRRCGVIYICFQPLLFTPELIERSIDLLYRSDFINQTDGIVRLFIPYMNQRQLRAFLRCYVMSENVSLIAYVALYTPVEIIRDELRDIELLNSYMTYGHYHHLCSIEDTLKEEVARRSRIPDSTEEEAHRPGRVAHRHEPCDHSGACICDLPQHHEESTDIEQPQTQTDPVARE